MNLYQITMSFFQFVTIAPKVYILVNTKYLVVSKKMKCITDIKEIIFKLEVNIEDELKTEKYAGGFDNDWVIEMQLKQDILDSLKRIVSNYEFILEQDNK